MDGTPDRSTDETPIRTGLDPNAVQVKSHPIRDVNGMLETIWLGICVNRPSVRLLCGACGKCVQTVRPDCWRRASPSIASAVVGNQTIQIPIGPTATSIPVPDAFVNVYGKTCEVCLQVPSQRHTPPPSCARCGQQTDTVFCLQCCNTSVGSIIVDDEGWCDRCNRDCTVCTCNNHAFDPMSVYF